MKTKMSGFFRNINERDRQFSFLSFLLSLCCFVLVSNKAEVGLMYFLIFSIFIVLVGYVAFSAENFNKDKVNQYLLRRIFIFLLPSAVILTYGAYYFQNVNFCIDVAIGIYWILAGIYLISNRSFQWIVRNEGNKFNPENIKKWMALQGKRNIFLVAATVFLYLLFSTYNIGKFAAVDEPLWTFKRIPSYWESIVKEDWEQTLISDKPGITVAILSGIGLIGEDPQKYDSIMWEGRVLTRDVEIEKMNVAFRLPIAVFVGLLLPLFYFLVAKILKKRVAQYSLILVGLSPILLGNARIINPDSLLWILIPISLLSYFAYIQIKNSNYLYLAGVFFGFSLLTKYVSNILFVFIFGLIFLEYALNCKAYEKIGTKEYLKQSLIDFSIFSFIALSIFYIFLPAAWVMPQELVNATVKSQAFESVWPYFRAIIISIILDMIFFKSFLYSKLLNFLARNSKFLVKLVLVCLLLPIIFVIFNVCTSMGIVNFEELLASPKMLKHLNFSSLIPRLNIFLSNFYPLVYGITPIALISVFFAFAKYIFQKGSQRSDKIVVFLISFVLLYYVGSAVNGVVSTIRYQIILFPIILIISAIGFSEITKFFKIHGFYISSLILLILSLISLYFAYPFYSSYASSLLPSKYSLDLKDMGAGSYEAAAFLNSLPNAKETVIWTDKQGVCYFFKGICYSGFHPNIKNIPIDYVVVSSGRKVRTEKMTRKDAPDFTLFYEKNDPPIFEVLIGGRSGQYVKIFKGN